jgi:hypothetical protein
MVVDERIAQLKGGQIESAEGRSLAARDLGALIATMPAAEVPRHVARTAEAIGVLHDTMTAVVAEAISPDEPPAGRSTDGMTADVVRPDRSTQQVTIAGTAFSDRAPEQAEARRPPTRPLRPTPVTSAKTLAV